MYKFYNQFRPFLYNFSLNVCDYIVKSRPQNFFISWLLGSDGIGIFLKSLKKCPIEAVREFVIK